MRKMRMIPWGVAVISLLATGGCPYAIDSDGLWLLLPEPSGTLRAHGQEIKLQGEFSSEEIAVIHDILEKLPYHKVVGKVRAIWMVPVSPEPGGPAAEADYIRKVIRLYSPPFADLPEVLAHELEHLNAPPNKPDPLWEGLYLRSVQPCDFIDKDGRPERYDRGEDRAYTTGRWVGNSFGVLYGVFLRLGEECNSALLLEKTLAVAVDFLIPESLTLRTYRISEGFLEVEDWPINAGEGWISVGPFWFWLDDGGEIIRITTEVELPFIPAETILPEPIHSPFVAQALAVVSSQ